MYKLYNFHLLNTQQSTYNLKISPEPVVEPTPQPLNITNIQSKPLQPSRNFLSMITNASSGKGCSSCGGR
jgi:hypothetical protein